MNVVNPNNLTHELKVIPRFYLDGNINVEIYNEQSKEVVIIEGYVSVNIVNGYLFINIKYDFAENQKYQVKIVQDNIIIYRGKLIATTQNTQNYKANKDLYYYE